MWAREWTHHFCANTEASASFFLLICPEFNPSPSLFLSDAHIQTPLLKEHHVVISITLLVFKIMLFLRNLNKFPPLIWALNALECLAIAFQNSSNLSRTVRVWLVDGNMMASLWGDSPELPCYVYRHVCVLMGQQSVSVRLRGKACVLWLRFFSLSCLSASLHLCASVHASRFFSVQCVQCLLVCKCVSPGDDNSPGHLTEGLQTTRITWRRLKATSLLPDLLLRLRRQLGHTGTHTHTAHTGRR